MTISIKPTSSGSTIEQDGGTILSVDSSGNLTVPNNITFSGTVTGVSSYEDSDALSLFNASGSAPVYACRAWINFDGTLSSNSIRGSGNVSSISDNGTGRHTINLITAMSDANYTVAVGGGVGSVTANQKPIAVESIATTSFQMIGHDPTGNSYADVVNATAAVFR